MDVNVLMDELKIDGISRVITDLSWYIDDMKIFTPAENETFEMDEDTEVFEIDPSENVFLPRHWKNYRSISNYLRRAETTVVQTNGVYYFLPAVIIGFLHDNDATISGIIWDRHELEPDNYQKKVALSLVKLTVKLGFIDQILVLNSDMKATVESELGASNVEIIRLGVSPNIQSKYDERDQYRDTIPALNGVEDKTIISFNGIFLPKRRLEDLLRAVASIDIADHEDVMLVLGGSLSKDREYSEKIRTMVDELSLGDSTIFLDELVNEEVAALYELSDIFVFPSINQSWGLAPLEAMVFGTPVVVSTGSGVTEILTDDVVELVPPKSPEDIARSLETLVVDEEARNEIGERGRAFVRDNYTMEDTANHLKQLWSGVETSSYEESNDDDH